MAPAQVLAALARVRRIWPDVELQAVEDPMAFGIRYGARIRIQNRVVDYSGIISGVDLEYRDSLEQLPIKVASGLCFAALK